jgi:predicted glycoside hydrolase/deacetylase ChbG (UPF0249 family)
MNSVPGSAPQAGGRGLIVNADDFGASAGINAGIAHAHEHGLVTSASLMVRMPGAAGAARLAEQHPGLSVGLHVDLTGEGTPAPADLSDVRACRHEIAAQLERFVDLLQRVPSHLDAHHNVYRLPHLEPLFVEVAGEWSLPLREHSSVTYFSDFYGQWDDGLTHLEWISPENLVALLDERVGPGITELSCHPGYVDERFSSSYHLERQHELRALCDATVRRHVDAAGFVLTNYDELRDTLMGVPS